MSNLNFTSPSKLSILRQFYDKSNEEESSLGFLYLIDHNWNCSLQLMHVYLLFNCQEHLHLYRLNGFYKERNYDTLDIKFICLNRGQYEKSNSSN